MYSHDMKDEQAPSRRRLLPEGNRKFVIEGCEPSVSKSGNDMFIVSLKDIETNYIDKVYLVATPKKRWALKNLLDSCDIGAAKDGVYSWEPKNILGKEIIGTVEHEDNEYINRNGETVKTKQHRISEFSKPEEIAWDEGK